MNGRKCFYLTMFLFTALLSFQVNFIQVAYAVTTPYRWKISPPSQILLILSYKFVLFVGGNFSLANFSPIRYKTMFTRCG